MSLAILACTGLDKPEGSVAREVAIRLAEEAGVEIVCPVVLNRTPARYKKALAENRLIVVDGCATQCASKLASAVEKKPAQKVIVSDVLKKSGRTVEPELRLAADGLALAQAIVEDIKAAEAAEEAKAAEEAEAAEAAKSQQAGGAGAAPVEVAFEPPADFLVVIHDKYEFRVPSSGFFFNENDVWAQVSGTRARVGISDYMQQRLTDISFVDPPEVGTSIEQFGEVGSVESTKASFELISPVSGTVIRVNDAVEDIPESINEDPYGSWIAELELTSWEEDQTLLIDGPAYAAEVTRKAAED
jgi:glycine cleavage system H protein